MEKEKYTTIWRNKWITADAKNIDDFINTFEYLAKEFKRWKDMGINLCPGMGEGDDYATFYTEDIKVALKAGFYYKRSNGTKILMTFSGKEVEVSEDLMENTE